jgi:hypothetical protein
MDSKRAGLSGPSLDDVVREALGQQSQTRKVMWLIPRNGMPFTMNTVYPPYDSLFSSDFRRQFHERFKVLEQTHWFDVYAEKSADFGHESNK